MATTTEVSVPPTKPIPPVRPAHLRRYVVEFRDEWGAKQQTKTDNQLGEQMILFGSRTPLYRCLECGKKVVMVWSACSSCPEKDKHKHCDHCTVHLCQDCRRNYIQPCKSCGGMSPRHLFTRLSSGILVCDSCYKNLCSPCESCGSKELSQELVNVRTSTTKVKKYCKKCASQYRTCTECNNKAVDDQISKLDNLYVCSKCLPQVSATCDCCKKLFHKRNAKQVARSGELVLLCNECFSTKYFKCGQCGSIHPLSKEHYTDRITKTHYCIPCYKREYNTSIQNYSLKPIPKWFGGGTSLFMGFELEVEMPQNPRGDEADRVIQYLHKNEICKEMLYYKSDGSLSHGIEVITHPFVFEWMKEHKEVIKHINGLANLGCASYHTRTCGFHVHMSKEAFTNAQLFKFMKLIYENQEFTKKISQRTSIERMSSYASLTAGNLINRAKHKNNPREERRGAVNLAPAHTVEVRIFQGNLNQSRIWKNLEFCHALWAFCNEVTFKEVTVPVFTKFIQAHKIKYKNLVRFLTGEVVKEDDEEEEPTPVVKGRRP